LRHIVYWSFLLTIAALLGGSAAYFAWPWAQAASDAATMTHPLPTELPTYTPAPSRPRALTTAVPTATPTSVHLVSPSGRENFLILASDNDSKKPTSVAPDTQVIIFVSYDTVRQQIYIVSIPRDLYVQIPGYIYDKIDTAPEYGGSFKAVISTVETDFGVSIDHYAWVGLDGFIKVIDTLGGVDIDVAHPMVESDFPDDLNPLTCKYCVRRFYIPSGPQHLDGTTALEYVRARHADLIGDFGRSQRQQQVLLQIKQKMQHMDFSIFPSLIEDMKGSVTTDLGLPEMLGLAKSVLGVSESSIHSYYLDIPDGYTSDENIPVGNGVEDALIPNWPKIDSLFQCILSDSAYKGCPN